MPVPRKARALAKTVARLSPAPELVVASPLTRALRTAELAFGKFPIPRLVCPLASERVYHSSDVGRNPEDIAADFPAWGGLEALPPVWWWHPKADSGGSLDPADFSLEPEQQFLKRVDALRLWLAQRPERSIALVAHWGVLEACTVSFKPCTGPYLVTALEHFFNSLGCTKTQCLGLHAQALTSVEFNNCECRTFSTDSLRVRHAREQGALL